MYMAKPSRRDIEAADELHGILSTIDARWGGPSPTFGPEDLGAALGVDDAGCYVEEFDAAEPKHLQALYNHLAKLLRAAPNFHGRVIGGMCHVICWDRNRILDPALDHLELHPDILDGLTLLAEHRATWLDQMVSQAMGRISAHVDAFANKQMEEMRAGWASASSQGI